MGDRIYILVMVLNKEEYLDDILDKLAELGVTGGTIIDSTGMAEQLFCNERIPIVGGLRQIFEQCRTSNKTLFSIIENKETLNKAQKVVQGEICDFNDPGIGISFSVPVENVIGIPTDNLNQLKS